MDTCSLSIYDFSVSEAKWFYIFSLSSKIKQPILIFLLFDNFILIRLKKEKIVTLLKF